jgi:hypothetical protein
MNADLKAGLDATIEIIDALTDFKSIRPYIEKGFDVETCAHWPNDAHDVTTLLLSRVEFRDFDRVKELLELGADVNAKSSSGFMIADLLLRGHCFYDGHDAGGCERMLKLLLPYNPPRKVSDSWILDSIQDDPTHPYLTSDLIVEFMKECRRS